MKALAPLLRELRIRYYEAARKQLQRRDPTHVDLPHVIRRIHELTAQRPRVEQRQRTPCAEILGMCARDPNCRKTHCPGRTQGLYQQDGGHEYRNGMVFPIEHERTGASA